LGGTEARKRIAVIKAVQAPVTPDRIRGSIAAAVQLAEVEARLPPLDWDLAVRLSGDRELRRLNRRYLHDDHATDVLSFASDDADNPHLGDIVISWPAVRRQALEFGHSEEDELSLLVVHGFLHLLGWDHATPIEEREMNRLTLAALDRVGVRPAPGRVLEPGSAG
jgi:probable rRNA maturation factor